MPKMASPSAPRQDKEREGAGREAANDAIVLAACLLSCLPWCLVPAHTFLPPTFER